MSNDASTAEQVDAQKISTEDVVEYLRQHPDFFISQGDLLADLSLPHESGKAISLLERQVTILRDRGIEARQKLNNLLENARNNDQLFDTTRNLVLALLRAKDMTEIANVTQDQLSNHPNIDACEIIFVENDQLHVSGSIRTESHDKLKLKFNDVFRLKRTHCGELTEKQLGYLFPLNSASIRSTALCPATNNSEVMALLAFGNQTEGYFNINLDTLFLDFIGRVIGAVLNKEFALSNQSAT
ncbi:MAG: DUF484 family protein [Gammaproteobacteria bacterium]|jgi:hypothetical protein|nr:hypothetical protein [Gammaproteobacteria bacterium]MDP6097048.1 DUF484 family protein [Gammaproteobacteria bacterium]|tara:strand:+ start:173 stop:898 length:726 start_codon:yes stop_codon:yes gene_type:complete